MAEWRDEFKDMGQDYLAHALGFEGDTGLTISAVHNQCNAVLWQYHGEQQCLN